VHRQRPELCCECVSSRRAQARRTESGSAAECMRTAFATSTRHRYRGRMHMPVEASQQRFLHAANASATVSLSRWRSSSAPKVPPSAASMTRGVPGYRRALPGARCRQTEGCRPSHARRGRSTDVLAVRALPVASAERRDSSPSFESVTGPCFRGHLLLVQIDCELRELLISGHLGTAAFLCQKASMMGSAAPSVACCRQRPGRHAERAHVRAQTSQLALSPISL